MAPRDGAFGFQLSPSLVSIAHEQASHRLAERVIEVATDLGMKLYVGNRMTADRTRKFPWGGPSGNPVYDEAVEIGYDEGKRHVAGFPASEPHLLNLGFYVLDSFLKVREKGNLRRQNEISENDEFSTRLGFVDGFLQGVFHALEFERPNFMWNRDVNGWAIGAARLASKAGDVPDRFNCAVCGLPVQRDFVFDPKAMHVYHKGHAPP